MAAAKVPRPSYGQTSYFWTTLRQRVDDHFAGMPRSGGGALNVKAAVILAWFAASYAAMLAAGALLPKLSAAVSLGLAAAAIGFNLFHDSSHGAFFAKPRANLWLTRAVAALLGADRHFWQAKHQHLHHSLPNVWQWDDDLESRGWLRLSPRQPWRPRYSYQHVYAAALYALNSFEWFFIKDFVQYGRRAVNPYQPVPRLERVAHLEFWLTKAAYLVVFVLPPIIAMPPLDAALTFVAFHATLGLALTFVFQLAHLNPVVDSGTVASDDDWAQHQLRTTADFATRNRLACWYMGGLNFQIEHHLFPQISHVHYPQLAAIVRKTAREHGLPYHHLGSFTDAVSCHFDHLRALARRPVSSGRSTLAGEYRGS